MKKNTTLTGGSLAVVVGLGTGCSAGSEPYPSSAQPNPAEVDASIQQSLERLRGLQTFSVDRLILNLPAEATACYSMPCPGDTAAWAAYHAESARQAQRLAALAAQAEDCNSGNCVVSMPKSAVDAVNALNALQIVEVGGLIQAQPKNNPDCYNLPCDSDRAAADAVNSRRAAEAFTIAGYAKQKGI